jgi:hypothetical protein
MDRVVNWAGGKHWCLPAGITDRFGGLYPGSLPPQTTISPPPHTHTRHTHLFSTPGPTMMAGCLAPLRASRKAPPLASAPMAPASLPRWV